jgi:hypothetical protein
MNKSLFLSKQFSFARVAKILLLIFLLIVVILFSVFIIFSQDAKHKSCWSVETCLAKGYIQCESSSDCKDGNRCVTDNLNTDSQEVAQRGVCEGQISGGCWKVVGEATPNYLNTWCIN